jgi:integrase
LTPHIFTDQELRSLLRAAKRLGPRGSLRGQTCAAIFGLIASAGLRISEATSLKKTDVDLSHGLLHIRHAKFGEERLVPLHPSAVRALRRYADTRLGRALLLQCCSIPVLESDSEEAVPISFVSGGRDPARFLPVGWHHGRMAIF